MDEIFELIVDVARGIGSLVSDFASNAFNSASNEANSVAKFGNDPAPRPTMTSPLNQTVVQLRPVAIKANPPGQSVEQTLVEMPVTSQATAPYSQKVSSQNKKATSVSEIHNLYLEQSSNDQRPGYDYKQKNGNPVMHVYTFPDVASAEAFINKLGPDLKVQRQYDQPAQQSNSKVESSAQKTTPSEEAKSTSALNDATPIAPDPAPLSLLKPPGDSTLPKAIIPDGTIERRQTQTNSHTPVEPTQQVEPPQP